MPNERRGRAELEEKNKKLQRLQSSYANVLAQIEERQDILRGLTLTNWLGISRMSLTDGELNQAHQWLKRRADGRGITLETVVVRCEFRGLLLRR